MTLLPDTTGPCEWCHAPAPELRVIPQVVDYDTRRVYRCPPGDWAACHARKVAVDAAKALPKRKPRQPKAQAPSA